MYRYLDLEQPSRLPKDEETLSFSARRAAVSLALSSETDVDEESGRFQKMHSEGFKKVSNEEGRGPSPLPSDDDTEQRHLYSFKEEGDTTEEKVSKRRLMRSPSEISLRKKMDQMAGRRVSGFSRDSTASQESTPHPPLLRSSSEIALRRKDEMIGRREDSSSQLSLPPSFQRSSRVISPNSLPGAFRVTSSFQTIRRQPSSGSVSVLSVTTDPRNTSREEVLVNAELVQPPSPQAVVQYSDQKVYAVEASPISWKDEPTTFLRLVWTNRRLQATLFAAGLVLVVASVLGTNLFMRKKPIFATVPPTPIPSPAPTTILENQVEFFISSQVSSSSREAMMDPFSAQSRALDWIQETAADPQGNYSDARIVQRYAMAVLYFATHGDKWTENEGWLENPDECAWHMSTGPRICDANGQLQKLHLNRNALRGTLPPDLALLTSLKELALPSNALTGTLPRDIFATLTQLTYLDVSNNNIQGNVPTEMEALTNLERLYLDENALTGSLPSEIGLMMSLQAIVVHDNILNGALPSELGLLTNLTALWSFRNALSGSIPSDLGQLTDLLELLLNDNDLTGALPTELGNLQSLQFVESHRNGLQGTIPSEMGNLHDLIWVNIGNNSLTGSLPVVLFENKDNLAFFSLHANDLTGSIPTEIGLATQLLQVYVDDNALTGTLPSEIGRLSLLTRFWASSNRITGQVPPEVCDMWHEIFLLDCSDGIDCTCWQP